jgi:hypothetical protein
MLKNDGDSAARLGAMVDIGRLAVAGCRGIAEPWASPSSGPTELGQYGLLHPVEAASAKSTAAEN